MKSHASNINIIESLALRIHRPPKYAATHGFTIVELLIVIVVIGVLAAITLVAYNGIQERARTASVSSALSQASKKLALHKTLNGSYPAALGDVGISNSPDESYVYTVNSSTNPETFCITAINGTTVYKITESTAPTAGGCNGQTWPGGVAMTNLVTNGDFSEGTTGWTIAGFTNVTTDSEVMTATTTSTTPRIEKGAAVPVYSSGNKLYIRLDTKIPSTINGYRAIIHRSTSEASAGTTQIPDGVWHTYSSIAAASGGGSSISLGAYFFASTTGAVVQLRRPFLLNLTATFGAGNEPTKEQMDSIMQQFPNSWFDGTVTADTRDIL